MFNHQHQKPEYDGEVTRKLKPSMPVQKVEQTTAETLPGVGDPESLQVIQAAVRYRSLGDELKEASLPSLEHLFVPPSADKVKAQKEIDEFLALCDNAKSGQWDPFGALQIQDPPLHLRTIKWFRDAIDEREIALKYVAMLAHSDSATEHVSLVHLIEVVVQQSHARLNEMERVLDPTIMHPLKVLGVTTRDPEILTRREGELFALAAHIFGENSPQFKQAAAIIEKNVHLASDPRYMSSIQSERERHYTDYAFAHALNVGKGAALVGLAFVVSPYLPPILNPALPHSSVPALVGAAGVAALGYGIAGARQIHDAFASKIDLGESIYELGKLTTRFCEQAYTVCKHIGIGGVAGYLTYLAVQLASKQWPGLQGVSTSAGLLVAAVVAYIGAVNELPKVNERNPIN